MISARKARELLSGCGYHGTILVDFRRRLTDGFVRFLGLVSFKLPFGSGEFFEKSVLLVDTNISEAAEATHSIRRLVF
jgi:hypothetical protein